MIQEMAEATGRAVIRPWRVGLLADASSAVAVRNAIADLSCVWGGRYMPIFDIGAPTEELERLGRQYDVDSLYGDVVDGPLSDLVNKPGWRWGGRGPWGPFGEEQGFRTGLLPTRLFIDASTDLVQPTWDSDDPADVALAAIWGLGDHLGLPLSPTLDDTGPWSISCAQLPSLSVACSPKIGVLEASTFHVRTSPRGYLNGYTGVYVIRPDHPEDVVEFWNMRTYGTKIIGVPATGAETLLGVLLSPALPGIEIRTGSGSGSPERAVRVWGLDDASE